MTMMMEPKTDYRFDVFAHEAYVFATGYNHAKCMGVLRPEDFSIAYARHRVLGGLDSVSQFFDTYYEYALEELAYELNDRIGD